MRIKQLSFNSLILIVCLTVGSVLHTTQLWAETNAQGLPSLAPMLDNVTPAVVNIATTRTARLPNQLRSLDERDLQRFFDRAPRSMQPAPTRAAGSGVIVDAEQGYIITNHHVVAGADTVTVGLSDDRQFTATVVGSDASTDIALLQIDAQNLKALPFADVSGLRVGDYVVAIGNPFGIGQTVTSGIVSALGRAGLNAENYEDFIQTDAAINMGNSGGALVDLAGNLVGINTAIISGSGANSGVGFAVPADMVAAVMEHLQRDGEVRRGQLGVQIRDYTPVMEHALGLGTERGALVTAVIPDSAAEQAGIKVSDVIIAIDGRNINSGRELRNIVGLANTSAPIELEYIRDGDRHTLTAQLATPQQNIAQNSVGGTQEGRGLDDSMFFGARLEAIGAVAGDRSGLAVVNVEPQSPAWQAGLRAGDIVYAVNRNEISNLRDFNEAVSAVGEITALSVVREDRELLVILS